MELENWEMGLRPVVRLQHCGNWKLGGRFAGLEDQQLDRDGKEGLEFV